MSSSLLSLAYARDYRIWTLIEGCAYNASYCDTNEDSHVKMFVTPDNGAVIHRFEIKASLLHNVSYTTILLI